MYLLHKAFQCVVAVGPPPQGVILDLGCSFGWTTPIIRYYFPQSRLISLDAEEEPVEYVQRHSNELAIVADATRLPLATESIDLIVAEQVIEHLENQDKLVEEISRVLKPQGFVIVGTIMRKWYGLSPYRNQRGTMVIGRTHWREYKSIQELVSQFGMFQPLATFMEPVWAPLFETLYQLLVNLKLVRYDPAFLEKHDPNLVAGYHPLTLLRKIKYPRPGFFHIYLVGRKGEGKCQR